MNGILYPFKQCKINVHRSKRSIQAVHPFKKYPTSTMLSISAEYSCETGVAKYVQLTEMTSIRGWLPHTPVSRWLLLHSTYTNANCSEFILHINCLTWVSKLLSLHYSSQASLLNTSTIHMWIIYLQNALFTLLSMSLLFLVCGLQLAKCKLWCD